MTRLVRWLAIIGAVASVTPSYADVLALDFTPPNQIVGSTQEQTLGWRFTVTSPITVTALGFFDLNSNGLVTSHDVGLWAANSTLLAQASITNASSSLGTSSSSSVGRWLFEDIPDLTLMSGDYVIGATLEAGQGQDFFVSNTTALTIGGIILGDPALSDPAADLVFPAQVNPSRADAFFGPNFLIAQVPEPTTLALLGIALAGLGFSRRRRIAAN